MQHLILPPQSHFDLLLKLDLAVPPVLTVLISPQFELKPLYLFLSLLVLLSELIIQLHLGKPKLEIISLLLNTLILFLEFLNCKFQLSVL